MLGSIQGDTSIKSAVKLFSKHYKLCEKNTPELTEGQTDRGTDKQRGGQLTVA